MAVCPECASGKCVNCVQVALDPETDEFVGCACEAGGHDE